MKKSTTIWLVVIIIIVVIVGIFISMNKSSTYTSATGSSATDASGQYAASTQPPQATLVATSTGILVLNVMTDPKLGTYLVASNGMTLYKYGNDASGVSNCSGQCLAAWPAYIASSTPPFQGGKGVGGSISTLTRSDGVLQLTYNGMPLYFWQKDSKPGDITGQKVNGFTIVTP